VLIQEYFPDLPSTVRTGPISLRQLWPRTITQDILQARRPTLFFVHLLTPHSPYLLDSQGNVLS